MFVMFTITHVDMVISIVCMLPSLKIADLFGNLCK